MASIDLIRASNGSGDAVKATVTNARVISSTTLQVDATTNWPSKFIATVGSVDGTGAFVPATVTVFNGILSGGNIEITSFAPGYTDIGNTPGQIVVLKPTTEWANNVVELARVSHKDDGSIKTAAVATALNAPQGFLINGKISRSVASNNLTVAIKTLAGTDPTADNPVYVRIGDSLRSITAALSITINAGTNWWGMGASYFVSTDQDFFAYLIWNTATSAVAIAIAREPDMRIYSDRNATSTNHGYLVANGTAPNSTDEMEVVGSFNATLGASASYNWSLPATAIVISRPIFETRVFSASNSGNAGGTLYWQQVGAVKKVWGTGLAGAISGSGFQSTLRNATFPVGFFATITSGQVTINSVNFTQFQWAIFNSINTATGAIYFIQANGVDGANEASIDVSGT